VYRLMRASGIPSPDEGIRSANLTDCLRGSAKASIVATMANDSRGSKYAPTTGGVGNFILSFVKPDSEMCSKRVGVRDVFHDVFVRLRLAVHPRRLMKVTSAKQHSAKVAAAAAMRQGTHLRARSAAVPPAGPKLLVVAAFR